MPAKLCWLVAWCECRFICEERTSCRARQGGANSFWSAAYLAPRVPATSKRDANQYSFATSHIALRCVCRETRRTSARGCLEVYPELQPARVPCKVDTRALCRGIRLEQAHGCSDCEGGALTGAPRHAAVVVGGLCVGALGHARGFAVCGSTRFR